MGQTDTVTDIEATVYTIVDAHVHVPSSAIYMRRKHIGCI